MTASSSTPASSLASPAAAPADPFGARGTLDTAGGPKTVFRLDALRGQFPNLDRLPYSIKVLLEACLRNLDGRVVTEESVRALAGYDAKNVGRVEIPFMPGRVVLQDFTGVPAVVDLAAMRDAAVKLKADPQRVNPLVPCDLVIDHSVQVDAFGSETALSVNRQLDYERNTERYQFLKWGQQAFSNFSVVPPATGIVHQVNLEYLAKVVWESPAAAAPGSGGDAARGTLFPDSLVGTDSHTTMINGLGVLGWGVGGIEAEAVMLGQPIYMLMPEVVGFRLTGRLREGCTATDLVLTVTQMLRKLGVVGRFVEFFGPGLADMPLATRATIANMAPEYGATVGFFPVDEQTLRYLEGTGRPVELIRTVEAYCKLQGLWRDDRYPIEYTGTLELDLDRVEPSLAGPKRPQDRIALSGVQASWRKDLKETFLSGTSKGGDDEDGGGAKKSLKPSTSGGSGAGSAAASSNSATAVLDEAPDPGATGVEVTYDGATFALKHGHVVIAAITSCTNTSNPEVMLAAGLLAKKAVARGLTRKPWVKTSLAPGSQVVMDYYARAGLVAPLEALGFYLVGYGCTTCIGNSGPLPEPISEAINAGGLVAAAVLSGNRNFEGRISPDVRANYLASPPLVVAYALAGTVDLDLQNDPLGTDPQGRPVYLRDLWPSQQEIGDAIASSVVREQFIQRYGNVFTGSDEWRAIAGGTGARYAWDRKSTYIHNPPYFETLTPEVTPITAIRGARCLVKLGDSVTTDHISPAGSIKKDSPAGQYLIEHGVPVSMFNSYGARRGNDEVMVRGTFANIRVRNQLAPGTEGGWTTDFTDSKVKFIYDASVSYRKKGVPLIVLAGHDYGMGSSRDWAAKGTFLLGVKAVIAQSYERIHRSNLVGMGVLPLVFRDGESTATLGLDGRETFDILLDDKVQPQQALTVSATKEDGTKTEFTTICRIDTPVEVDYYRNGGILHTVLRQMAGTHLA